MTGIIGSGLELYIKRNARDTALNRRAEAERRAQDILAEAQKRIEIMERDTAASTRLRIVQNRRRLLAQADLSAKQIILSRREAVMEEVWAQVEQTVRQSMTPERRLELIWCGLLDAAHQLGGGDLAFQVNAPDRDLITEQQLDQWREKLTALGVNSLTLADEPAHIWGGVIARRDAVRQMVDNSWNERLALARRVLRDQVYRQLTSDEQPE